MDATPPAHVSAAPEAAPERGPERAVFVEALGSGLLYSLNYEHFLAEQRVGVRGGAGFITYKVSKAEGSGNLTLATFPILLSYYFGTAHHKLEIGLGATAIYFSAATDATGTKFEGEGTGLGIAASGVVGYRYVPTGRGATFGVGFTPLLRVSKGFLPWGGAHVGYAF
jgi:hypothetical protein